LALPIYPQPRSHTSNLRKERILACTDQPVSIANQAAGKIVRLCDRGFTRATEFGQGIEGLQPLLGASRSMTGRCNRPRARLCGDKIPLLCPNSSARLTAAQSLDTLPAYHGQSAASFATKIELLLAKNDVSCRSVTAEGQSTKLVHVCVTLAALVSENRVLDARATVKVNGRPPPSSRIVTTRLKGLGISHLRLAHSKPLHSASLAQAAGDVEVR
jgi:hypothetical protein